MDGSKSDSLSYSESDKDEYNNNRNGGNGRGMVLDGLWMVVVNGMFFYLCIFFL